MKKNRIYALCAAMFLGVITACGGAASTGASSAAASTEKATESTENAKESTAESASAVDNTTTAVDKESASEPANGTAAEAVVLEDGVYTAEFQTDSSMFHVNEANEGKGTLTVKDGKMTIHVSLASTNIVNLFCGTAEDAAKDGSEILAPTTDTVKYKDGATEEVNGFDMPVPAIGEEFDCAILGKKGKWYDHKVSVLNPVKAE